jgi:hypothetical protein
MTTSMRKIWSLFIAMVGFIIPPFSSDAATGPQNSPAVTAGEPATRPPRPTGRSVDSTADPNREQSKTGVPQKPAQQLAGKTLREARNTLLDMWVKDPAFNRNMRRDPVGTLESQGVKLTEEDRAAVRRMNWKASDEELKDAALRWSARPGDYSA